MNSQQRAPHNTCGRGWRSWTPCRGGCLLGGELGRSGPKGDAVAPVRARDSASPDAGRRFALATDTVTLLRAPSRVHIMSQT